MSFIQAKLFSYLLITTFFYFSLRTLKQKKNLPQGNHNKYRIYPFDVNAFPGSASWRPRVSHPESDKFIMEWEKDFMGIKSGQRTLDDFFTGFLTLAKERW